MRKICMVLIGVTSMLAGYSQTTGQQVEKLIEDPNRKANAGKADAIIADKKTIFDSTTFKDNTNNSNNNKTLKASTSKKHCGDKTKPTGRANASKKKA
jgi:hypothetical protein